MSRKEKVHQLTVTPVTVLAELPVDELKEKQLSQQLQDTTLETKLLLLADVSIEREIELLRDILDALKKL